MGSGRSGEKSRPEGRLRWLHQQLFGLLQQSWANVISGRCLGERNTFLHQPVRADVLTNEEVHHLDASFDCRSGLLDSKFYTRGCAIGEDEHQFPLCRMSSQALSSLENSFADGGVIPAGDAVETAYTFHRSLVRVPEGTHQGIEVASFWSEPQKLTGRVGVLPR